MSPATSATILSLQLVASLLAVTTFGDAFLTEFVTLKRTSNWTHGFQYAQVLPSRMGRQVASFWSSGDRYKLRFRPDKPLKTVLFWHKFPNAQQVEPNSSTTAPTSGSQPPTENSVMEMGSDPIAEMMTTVAPATTASVTIAEETTTPTTTTTRSPPTPITPTRPASTITTIMRPHNILPPPPQMASTLQQLLPLFGSPLEANLIEKQQAVSRPSPQGKGFLSLFEVIKFENKKCSVAMGEVRTLEGVCYHEFECKSLGGIPTQRCGEGVGVCCVCCGETTNQPIVYFESPNYPNAVREMLICVLIVNLRPNVLQLRLDFLMFELNRPTEGECLDDQFIVSGQDMNFVVPVLCGINTGQHIYIDVGNSLEQKIYLSFFAKVPAGGRSFNIQITQLESDLAPVGCLQYHTNTWGVVKSFNYDVAGSVVDNPEATYLNNLNYAICLQRAKEACSVTYAIEIESVSGDQLDFQLVNKDEAENDLVPDGQAGAGIFNCPDDFIAINQVRLCGERFNDGTENDDFTVNAPVKDNAAGPIILPVRSDAEYVGHGFRLLYKQELCA